MKAVGLWFLIVAVVLLLAPPVARAQKVHLIHLDPQPSISGGCPAKVHFSGRIATDGPLEVTYQWLRSDGSHSEHTINFARASTQNISTDWSISKNYEGTMQLVILSPQHLQTAKARFSVNCGR